MTDLPAVRTPQGVIRFKSQDAFGAYLQDSGLVATPRVSVGDGMMNVLTGVGGSTDGAANLRYFIRPYSDATLEASFRSSWISDKIHRMPPRDMIRSWRAWKADPEQITAIEREERRVGLRAKVEDALVWARLYGGSCIMLGINGDDPATPLNINTVRAGSLRYAHVLTKSQISIPNLVLDPGSEFYLQPTEYLVNSGNGQQVRVHPSRMVRFIGKKLPENLTLANSGWGDPLLATVESAVMQSDSIQASFAAVAARAREDTIAIPGLTNIASTEAGEKQLQKRILVAAAFRSMFNVTLLDGGNGEQKEEWNQFQPVFAGMKDVMLTFLQFVCGAADVPVTRFGGMSPGGLNSTGDGDLENYHNSLSAGQELDLRPRLEMIDEVLLRSALGERPPEIFFTFNPLKIDSDEVRAKNAKLRAETSAIYADTGLVPVEVMQESVKGQLIENGEYPGIETAYNDYVSGTLEPIIEEQEEEPDDPLIPVDETGAPRLNRESRLFAANDIAARLIADGAKPRIAAREAARLTDAAPRPVYVSRRLLNGQEVVDHFEKQGLPVTVALDKLHTTIIYSKAPVDWIKAGGGSWGTAELTVPAGGPRMLDRFGPNADAVVLMFASPEMSWRHRELLESGCSHDFDFHAHLTLRYEGWDGDLTTVEPYKGELRFGFENWQEIDPDWSGK